VAAVSKARDEILERLSSAFRPEGDLGEMRVVRVEPAAGADGDAMLMVALRQFDENKTGYHVLGDRNALLDSLANNIYSRQMRRVACDFRGLLAEPWLLKGLTSKLPSTELLDVTTLEFAEIASCDAGLTAADAIIATTGTIALSAPDSRRLAASLLPRTHLCVASVDRIVPDLAAWNNEHVRIPGLHRVLVTGPSRSADIEKRLVLGVHGPWKVSVFLVQSAGEDL